MGVIIVVQDVRFVDKSTRNAILPICWAGVNIARNSLCLKD